MRRRWEGRAGLKSGLPILPPAALPDRVLFCCVVKRGVVDRPDECVMCVFFSISFVSPCTR